MPSIGTVRVLLTCGHQTVWVGRRDYVRPCPDQVFCTDPLCMREEMVTGVECREWHVKCKSCSYGKWCGASEADATHLVSRHFVHSPSHDCGAEFELNRKKADAVLSYFGRLVQIRLGRQQ